MSSLGRQVPSLRGPLGGILWVYPPPLLLLYWPATFRNFQKVGPYSEMNLRLSIYTVEHCTGLLTRPTLGLRPCTSVQLEFVSKVAALCSIHNWNDGCAHKVPALEAAPVRLTLPVCLILRGALIKFVLPAPKIEKRKTKRINTSVRPSSFGTV